MTESAAEILLAARLRAQLSQQELAARAGITQSVVSAYERGRREPSLATLRRLVDATGGRLIVAYDPPADRSSLLEHVRSHRVELTAALAAHGARNIRVFGSAARGDEHPGSDVDLLVDLDGDADLVDLAEAEHAAELLLGTAVDIVPFRDLKPYVREAALHEMVPL